MSDIRLVAIATDAPVSYDYGYCRESMEIGVFKNNPVRRVLVPRASVDYQCGRYASGLHLALRIRTGEVGPHNLGASLEYYVKPEHLGETSMEIRINKGVTVDFGTGDVWASCIECGDCFEDAGQAEPPNDDMCPSCADEAVYQARCEAEDMCRDDDDFLIDGVGFANPGGNSALRAATPDNPRNLPCPNCGTANVLTPADKRAGYQCDACADRAEGGGEY